LWNDVDAGSQPSLHQRVGDFSGFFLRTGGGKDNAGIAHRNLKSSLSIWTQDSEWILISPGVLEIGNKLVKPFPAKRQLTEVL
jgi:hypothetical protein